MTQSIVFIMCANEEEAKIFTDTTTSAVFINNICRFGNFNNIRILQHFPIPDVNNYSGNHKEIYDYFNITDEENIYRENL
jgi:hypothetical protein